jgi:D-serine deaminase-like pyridoxal phosphate-dependent protein
VTGGTPLAEIDTPALVIDLDAFDRNAQRLSRAIQNRGKTWRPHTKAHKSPELALRQIQIGAVGVTCAKVSEAAVMVDHGIPSVLIANELALPAKARRVAELEQRAEVIICADSPAHVALAAAAASDAGVVIPMLVDVDVGLGRTGVAPGELALALARLINSTRGVRFAGLMGYEGQLESSWPMAEKRRIAAEWLSRLVGTARQIEAHGIPVPIVSAGSSGSYIATAEVDGVTEIQAGGACLMDIFYAEDCHLADEGFEFALTIHATVVSHVQADRLVVDAGFKTMSSRGTTFPRPINVAGLEVLSLSAEHATLRATGPGRELSVGDRVVFVPDYSDATTFLHNTFVASRAGYVDHLIPLLTRGFLT